MKNFANIRSDTIMASFLVALFSSLLMALVYLLLRVLAASPLNVHNFLDYFLNIYILIGFSIFVFFWGSKTAAWFVYRHEMTWAYKLEAKQILPIFAISFIMALAVFGAATFFIQAELPLLTYLVETRSAIGSIRAR